MRIQTQPIDNYYMNKAYYDSLNLSPEDLEKFLSTEWLYKNGSRKKLGETYWQHLIEEILRYDPLYFIDYGSI